MRRAALCVLLVSSASWANVEAQSVIPAGRIEVGAGVEWIGQAALGTIDATETTPAGPPAVLFTTSSVLAGSLGLDAHIGVRVTRSIEAEIVGSRSKPQLRTTISNDIEAAPVVATDTITQYVVGGGVLWYLPFRIGPPDLRPFVDGSAAYVRQLHEGNTLVDTGQLYRVNGGVKLFFPAHSASWFKGYGVRAEAGLGARVKGVAFDSSVRYAPAAAASIFMRF